MQLTGYPSLELNKRTLWPIRLVKMGRVSSVMDFIVADPWLDPRPGRAGRRPGPVGRAAVEAALAGMQSRDHHGRHRHDGPGSPGQLGDLCVGLVLKMIMP